MSIEIELADEAREFIKPILFWTRKSKIEKYIIENITPRLERHLAIWQDEKQTWETEQSKEIKRVNRQNEESFIAEKQYLEQMIDNDSSSGEKIFEKRIQNLSLPLAYDLSFEIRDERLLVDLDLPEIEDFPVTMPSQLASGKFNIKKKPQKTIKEDYAKATLGLAYFIASLGFNSALAINSVTIQGYTQRVSPQTGQEVDDYIFEIDFNRETFSELNTQNIDPIKSIELFRPKMNLLKSYAFRTITPSQQHSSNSP